MSSKCFGYFLLTRAPPLFQLFFLTILWLICYAAPPPPLPVYSAASSSAAALASITIPMARLDEISLLKSITDEKLVANLTRQHDGDVFIANGMPACNTDTCVGLSSGTAGLFVAMTRSQDTSGKTRHPTVMSTTFKKVDANVCECQCLPYLNTFREDLGICVDDIHECTLSPFISGSSSEKIPFVFLPLRGQIIHPSREISFPGVRTPVCAVSGSQYLSEKGWSELRNPIDTDFPFRLFRDEGRTFLQWLGETDLRQKMQGRLILVHLMCRDMSPPNLTVEAIVANATDHSKNIFTPCVAFRVNGNPVKYVNNVSEVLFQSESTANLSTPSEGLTTKEYVVIGICSLLLGLIYVASVFLYLHVKKRKSQLADALASINDPKNDINYPKNDQVTFGTPFTRHGSSYSTSNTMEPRNNNQRSRRNSFNGSASGNINGEEIGIVKNNPLLKHYPNLSDRSGFVSDISNSNSECEDTHSAIVDKFKNMQTSATVHPASGLDQTDHRSLDQSSPTQENECLPEENVSIIEEMVSEDKLENMRAIVNGTIRKKLYFNPAYFEPHLLLSPPPAAIEFLQKIREVIAIAKYKMATKRFQPSLTLIPEEFQGNNSDIYTINSNTQGSTLTAKTKRNNGCGEQRSCSGCPGCSAQNGDNDSQNSEERSKCGNCGDKRSTIQKWLEGVDNHNTSSTVSPKQENKNGDSCTEIEKGEKTYHEKPKNVINLKSPNAQNSIKKRPPPPLPPTAPKIISHSLKTNISNNLANDDKAKTTALKPSVNHIITRPLDSPPPQPKRDPLDIYNKIAKSVVGTEIFNNPKFSLNDSPQLSQRSKASSSQRFRSSRKRIEVLDQYANPSKTQHDMLRSRSMRHMPDMVYEAIAKDYSFRNFTSERPSSGSFSIPTPDYDSTCNKSLKEIYNNSTHSSGPYVPTPDYSTLEKKKSLRQYQPDSPIYRRKSPQYLIVDYETDSLERSTSAKKGISSVSPSSSNGGSEMSSHQSPSLSTALPLEEEVEVHHTVYDKVEGFRKDGEVLIKKKILIPQKFEDIRMSLRKERPMSPRIKYDTPFRGSMTIEVEHDPDSGDLGVSTDSDQFEPDTLDRKPKKPGTSGSKSSNAAWSEHLKKSQNFVNGGNNYSSLENMTLLPDFNNDKQHQVSNDKLVLRSSSSFRSTTGSVGVPPRFNEDESEKTLRPSFGSLREIYQSTKFHRQLDRPKLKGIDFTEQGRLLTLEAKHSKRQRQNTEVITTTKIMPPDVIPSERNLYYDTPKSPAKKAFDSSDMPAGDQIYGRLIRKNFKGWNTDNFRKSTTASSNRIERNQNAQTKEAKHHSSSKNLENNSNEDTTDETNDETTSQNSESTEITGVSDTHANSSEYDETIKNNSSFKNYVPIHMRQNDSIYNRQNDLSATKKVNKSNPQLYEHMTRAALPSYHENLDEIEVICSKSLSNHSTIGRQESQSPIYDRNNMLNVQKVYRMEVNHASNGMQIAMGLRDQAKKTKDLKNAWKKFVSMAASKFQNGQTINVENDDCEKCAYNPYEKGADLIDTVDRDEGMFSLTDEGAKALSTIARGSLENRNEKSPLAPGVSCSNFSCSDQGVVTQKHHEQDSGYISGESSNDSKAYSRRVYERYNFKSRTDHDHIIGVETIEDRSEEASVKSKSVRSLRCSTPGPKRRNSTASSCSSSQEKIDNSDKIKSCNNVTSSFSVNLAIENSAIQVNVYSSDDEPYTSASLSSDSDGEDNTGCESGAESVETHSVLYKNTRNSQKSNNNGSKCS